VQSLRHGTWFTIVSNSISDYRSVPNGLTITGDSWTLENEDWLALDSIDISMNEVLPTRTSAWGAIKALYR
jgi:hypothetical protein